MAWDGNGQVTKGVHTLGNLLKKEFWAENGYCRKTLPRVDGVTYAVGDLLKADGSIAAAAEAADVVGVCLVNFDKDAKFGSWAEFEPTDPTAAGFNAITVLYRGAAIISDKGINFPTGTTEVQKTAFITKLEELGITVGHGL